MNTDTIGLLGDLHGNTSWAKFAIKAFAHLGVDTVLQVGDFGLYNQGRNKQFLDETSAAARRAGVTLYVVPGNHENWDYINHTIGASEDWVPFRDNIMVAPRVHSWVWNDVKFTSLSGAPSVDRTWRQNSDGKNPPSGPTFDRYHYAEEAITPQDVDAIKKLGGADVMVGHDAPFGVPTIELMIQNNPHGFLKRDLDYAAEGRALMTEAFDSVAPAHFFHGHYHFAVSEAIDRPRHEGEQTHVLGLNRDTMVGSLGTYHTGNGVADHLGFTQMLWEYRNGTLL